MADLQSRDYRERWCGNRDMDSCYSVCIGGQLDSRKWPSIGREGADRGSSCVHEFATAYANPLRVIIGMVFCDRLL
jgi:hypothetical protein